MKFLKVLFFIIAVFIAVDVHAQSSAELKRRRDRLTDELEQLNKDYQETSQNKRATLKQLSLLKAQINLREEKINIINSEVRNLDNQISESNNTVHSLQNQLDQLKKEYAAMVLFAYRNQSAYNKLMFIFASKDFNQAYKRLKYLQQFGTYRERQAGYIQGTQKELHVKINELDKNKQEKSNLLADQQKEKETLGKEKNNQVKVVSDLSQHQGQLKQQQREVQAKIAKMNREISATIRREIEEAKRKAAEEAREAARIAAAKAKAENKPAPVAAKPVERSTSSALNATPEAAKLSNDFLGNRGRLPWPVANGGITQGFGIYTTPEGIRSESNGVDIRTNPGSSVRAVFDGTVVRVVDVSGTYLVMILHGEYFTVYGNLKSASVARGQKVTTKQVIGTVATDPSTGETEAHFEVYKGATAVNPKIWLAPN
ncbi:murein hydrolase activator EnvC family protein [Mucilaginibacter pocheonensis]|uniref:Septal ring factor EnvC (AmiA/AmiB activator) n=1 Tax=Mucilaginibacter pocheonensis TaxID=398050 RepID=A0ABU1TDD1_9SPHI|nr:peptidoglycan DD-metalloendopeptidase family protein [Mucilaginibacter pocheonensis]MDR6942855.1 septal ring factor EnvC (AmiA/AmiB activator) [Mucilaginibacter pocheonensis]